MLRASLLTVAMLAGCSSVETIAAADRADTCDSDCGGDDGDSASGPAMAERVTQETQSVCAMVADSDDRVYWADCRQERIFYWSEQALAPIQLVQASGRISALAVDETHAYWTDAAGVWRADKTTGVAEVVLAGEQFFGLAVGDVGVYWSRVAHGSVAQVLQGSLMWRDKNLSTEPQTLVDEPAGAIAASGEDVFYAHAARGTLERISKGGGTSAVLAETDPVVDAIVVREGVIYWSDDAGVSRVPVDGGQPRVIGSYAFGGFEVSNDTLYYADKLHVLMRRLGSNPTPLCYTHGDGPGSPVGGLTVTTRHIYWGSSVFDGVWRITRPADG